MTYDTMLLATDSFGLIVREKDLQAYDGRIKGRRVAIRKSIPTNKQKACVLAEELGHYITSAGDLLDGDSVNARKQERRARMWAYDLQVGLSGIIRAKHNGCRNAYEIADYLDVPQSFLCACLDSYRQKYGEATRYHGYIVRFEPYLDVLPDQEEKNG